MQKTQLMALEAGEQVQAFLDQNAASIGKAVTAKLRADLDSAVAQLAKYRVEQGTSKDTALGETTAQQAQRQMLYEEFLHPIARIARRALPLAPEYPTFLSALKTAGTVGNVGDATIVANVVTKYEPIFVDNGMPADFIARMGDAITALSASKQSRGLNVSTRKGATAALLKAERELRDILGTFDIVFRTRLKKDPALLAAWNGSRKIVRLRIVPNPNGTTPLTRDQAPAGEASGATPTTSDATSVPAGTTAASDGTTSTKSL